MMSAASIGRATVKVTAYAPVVVPAVPLPAVSGL